MSHGDDDEVAMAQTDCRLGDMCLVFFVLFYSFLVSSMNGSFFLMLLLLCCLICLLSFVSFAEIANG